MGCTIEVLAPKAIIQPSFTFCSLNLLSIYTERLKDALMSIVAPVKVIPEARKITTKPRVSDQIFRGVVSTFSFSALLILSLIAVFLFNEQFTHGHAVAFACIWLALVMVSVEPFQRARRRMRG